MSFQFSAAVRNASLDAIETAIGATATLELRSGAAPANCAAADTGTLLATITLPSTGGGWMADAAAGAKALLGTWQTTASAAGTAGHFRVKAASGCHIQGSVTISGGGGDMTIDNPALTVGQTVTITGFTLTAGGA